MSYQLTIWTDDSKLFEKYTTMAGAFQSQGEHYNSGFDLIVSQSVLVEPGSTGVKINHRIVAAMTQDGHPTGFYMYPRSSISKTPLRMSNSVGIIDSGYRGMVLGMVDNMTSASYSVIAGDRLFQICSPLLSRFEVRVVWMDDLSVLSETTVRGSGGIGSTGK